MFFWQSMIYCPPLWKLHLSTQNCRIVWSCNRLVSRFLWLVPLAFPLVIFETTSFSSSSNFTLRALFQSCEDIYIVYKDHSLSGVICSVAYHLDILTFLHFLLQRSREKYLISGFCIFTGVLDWSIVILMMLINFAGTSNPDNILYCIGRSILSYAFLKSTLYSQHCSICFTHHYLVIMYSPYIAQPVDDFFAVLFC